MTEWTNWSALEDACGTAEHVPALLDRFEADPSGTASELIDHLCPLLDTAFTASFAALPRLAALAEIRADHGLFDVLVVAGSIVSCAATGSEVFEVFAAPIADLHRLTDRRLRTTEDAGEYVDLLQFLLSFEGVETWDRCLDGVGTGEYEVECPHCGVPVFLVTGDGDDCADCFATTDDHALGEAGKIPLRPAASNELDGLADRLHRRALADAQPSVAHGLRHLFGPAACPDCGTAFRTADRVAANSTY
ncbi:hypothetical protein HUT16_36420 [Kitasatospora sp. NA04385]|uniref:hypothetical protein n=1 Tax=Kitasatospora sp. NA04385 TaxID=2742135 RepID=UPI0015915718|nr:hypothetical protein [Kitasatospora sp. NA04385]QKW23863.1 hypothetical protein HUT16_36420 [Kitasatospora sp. NA04385]